MREFGYRQELINLTHIYNGKIILCETEKTD